MNLLPENRNIAVSCEGLHPMERSLLAADTTRALFLTREAMPPVGSVFRLLLAYGLGVGHALPGNVFWPKSS